MALSSLTLSILFPNGETAAIIKVAKDGTGDTIFEPHPTADPSVNASFIARPVRMESACVSAYLKQIVKWTSEEKADSGYGTGSGLPEYLSVSAKYETLPFIWSPLQASECEDVANLLAAKFIRL